MLLISSQIKKLNNRELYTLKGEDTISRLTGFKKFSQHCSIAEDSGEGNRTDQLTEKLKKR